MSISTEYVYCYHKNQKEDDGTQDCEAKLEIEEEVKDNSQEEGGESTRSTTTY